MTVRRKLVPRQSPLFSLHPSSSLVDSTLAPFFRLLVCDPACGPQHMAYDEAVALLAVLPTLRVYSWERPEFTIGYATRWQEALLATGDHPTTRRITGGGIVAHGWDITFALMLPSTTPAAILPASLLYSKIHAVVQDALGEEFGIATNLVSGEKRSPSNECFRAPVSSDLIYDGKKILGGAQRRLRQGILYQGSLRVDLAPASFAKALAARLAPITREDELSLAERNLASSLENERYRCPKWNEKR